MLVLTETDVEEGAVLTEKLRQLVQRQQFAVEGNPDLSVTISIGIAGGAGTRSSASRRWSATPMRRCTRRSRWAATRPTSSPSPTTTPASRARRSRTPAGPARWRSAARRATPRPTALASFIDPLPHYRGQPSALIASIVVDIARQLAAARGRDRPDPARGAPPRRRQGRDPRGDPGEAGRRCRPAEWRSVVQHPRIGQVILEQAAALKDAVPIILHHHERYAGHGYPYGLRANEIPLGARIVAIADAYDAMIHDRPYKRAMTHDAGDRRAAPPCRDAVRSGAGEPVLRPLRAARAAARPVGAGDDDGRGR